MKTLSATLTLLLALCFVVHAATLDAHAAATVNEKATGVAFPIVREQAGAAHPLDLTGTGVRTKLVFKVYAFALYVDGTAAKTELSRFAGRTADALRADPAFYAAVAGGTFDRLAVLHFVRTVDGKKMQEAMTEAMDRGLPAADPARAAFLALWNDEIKDGEEVLLHFSPSGTVTLLRGGKSVGAVASPLLARCLLQSWLGPDPVSTDIQAGVVARFPEVLK